jgi:hypothetical protein
MGYMPNNVRPSVARQQNLMCPAAVLCRKQFEPHTLCPCCRQPCVDGPGVNCAATNPKRVKNINRVNVNVPLGRAQTPQGRPAIIPLPQFAATPMVVPKVNEGWQGCRPYPRPQLSLSKTQLSLLVPTACSHNYSPGSPAVLFVMLVPGP